MKLFVSNFPFRMTDSDLAEEFQRFGQVLSSKVVTDVETGRSKGFGFVEIADANRARMAISEMHGSDCGGRTLRVEASLDSRGGARTGR